MCGGDGTLETAAKRRSRTLDLDIGPRIEFLASFEALCLLCARCLNAALRTARQPPTRARPSAEPGKPSGKLVESSHLSQTVQRAGGISFLAHRSARCTKWDETKRRGDCDYRQGARNHRSIMSALWCLGGICKGTLRAMLRSPRPGTMVSDHDA